MRVETTRFGSIDVDDREVITFTHPIIGFQEFRRFVLLPGPEDSGLRWLQSTDEADLAFVVMDPKSVMPDYRVRLGQHERTELAIDSEDELEVYTLVVVSQDPSQVRTNLKAPVVINPKQRLAKQTILEHSDYPVRFTLTRGEAQASQEVSHARSDT